MKIVAAIAGALLGFLFVFSAIAYFFDLVKMPPPPAGSAAASFMAAFIPTGYMSFVKTFELIGGLLVAIPRTRNLGLLVLGPIILNILAFNIFVLKGGAVFQPPVIMVAVIAAGLLWCGRKAFAGLVG
jgi:putative oxidoreductase